MTDKHYQQMLNILLVTVVSLFLLSTAVLAKDLEVQIQKVTYACGPHLTVEEIRAGYAAIGEIQFHVKGKKKWVVTLQASWFNGSTDAKVDEILAVRLPGSIGWVPLSEWVYNGEENIIDMIEIGINLVKLKEAVKNNSLIGLYDFNIQFDLKVRE